MLSAVLSSSNAMGAFQQQLNNASNNLANMNTTAFKRNVIQFRDLVQGSDLKQIPSGALAGELIPRGFAQGTITSTGRDTDLAINGTGFFVVQASDGSFKYTRDGSFNRDANGQLITSGGLVVQPPITLPSNALSTVISPDGTVTVTTSANPTVPKVVGQIQVASFENQEKLRPETGNFWIETESSGPPKIGTAGSGGLGQIRQASLEQSNVDLTAELTNLVTTQQAFSANSKAVNVMMQLLESKNSF